MLESLFEQSILTAKSQKHKAGSSVRACFLNVSVEITGLYLAIVKAKSVVHVLAGKCRPLGMS